MIVIQVYEEVLIFWLLKQKRTANTTISTFTECLCVSLHIIDIEDQNVLSARKLGPHL